MNTKFDLSAMGQGMVYFRDVPVSDLPKEVQDQAEGFETICSVYNHNGEQIALVANAHLAAHLAREFKMEPVTLQ